VTGAGGLRRASLLDSIGLLLEVLAPTIAKGVIIRRPRVVGLAARLDLDRRAVRRLQRLRRRGGPGPLVIVAAGRRQAVVLEGADAQRVLQETPEPFSPSSSEKRAALAHFEPGVSLVSVGAERALRRGLQDAVLESDRSVHSLCPAIAAAIEEDAARLAQAVAASGRLDWRAFSESWMHMARRITLGPAAADDAEITAMAAKLRSNANWAFARPVQRKLRSAFHARLAAQIERAEPDCLAGRIAALRPDAAAAPADQAAHWVFAFDAAGVTSFRTLALLATHPAAAERARAEIAAGSADLPYLRACVADAVRLWPTTPAILRQSTRPTVWAGEVLPAGAGVLVFTPLFTRDGERLPQADRFAPELWLGRDPADNGALVPFSAGPAACPGRHLTTLTGALFLAALMRRLGPLRTNAPLDAGRPLPGTLNHAALWFAPSPHAAA